MSKVIDEVTSPQKELRVIISGGGTGGHIFPAVSIANAIKAQRPDAKILFVGAIGRMEMQRVPAAGYEIKGLPICGFDRKNLLKNIKVLYKIWKSQRMAKQIIREFKPQVAVGVGGYASGPTLNKAAAMGIGHQGSSARPCQEDHPARWRKSGCQNDQRERAPAP